MYAITPANIKIESTGISRQGDLLCRTTFILDKPKSIVYKYPRMYDNFEIINDSHNDPHNKCYINTKYIINKKIDVHSCTVQFFTDFFSGKLQNIDTIDKHYINRYINEKAFIMKENHYYLCDIIRQINS